MEVTYFDEGEASLAKEAKTFSESQYDNETASSGAFGKLEEINSKITKIGEEVAALTEAYKELEGMYDTFTNFNEVMDRNIYQYETVIGNISTKYNDLNAAIQERVGEQVKADTELNEQITEQATELQADETGAEGADAAGTAGAAAGGAEAAGGATPNQSLSAIADEVISGKWGTGEDRKKALEAAGYDPSQIQDIVNKKIKGTYTEGDQGTGSGAGAGGGAGTGAGTGAGAGHGKGG